MGHPVRHGPGGRRRDSGDLSYGFHRHRRRRLAAANDDPPWAVADWLTSINFPKAENSQKPESLASNVTSLMRRPIYRGEEVFRTSFSERELRTGRPPGVVVPATERC